MDDKRFGLAPPMTHLNLPQGTRTIELSNLGFETVKGVKRVVPAINGQTVAITHDFDAR